MNTWWSNFKENELVDLSRQYWDTFKEKLDEWWNDFRENTLPGLEQRYSYALDRHIDRFRNHLIDDFKGTNHSITLTSIDTRIGTTITDVGTAITAIAGVATNVESVITMSSTTLFEVSGLVAAVTGVGTLVGAVEGTVSNIKKSADFVKNKISPFKPNFHDYLEDKFQSSGFDVEESLNAYREKYHDQLIDLIVTDVEKVISNEMFFKNGSVDKLSLDETSKTISDEVTNKIVGESYAKWNSVTSFYPTVIFIMKEVTENEPSRRAQIKLRYPKRAEDITDQDIADLI